jgi:hypothetical protein
MKRLLILTVFTLACFTLCAYVYWGHVCACPKDPDEHFAVWNPFRDFGPERAADRFFHELSTAQCQPKDEVLCRRTLARQGLIKDWDLSTRRTEGGTVRLTYYVSYAGRDGDPWPEYVEVERASDGWRIVGFSGAEWPEF